MRRHAHSMLIGWLIAAMAVLPLQAPTAAMAARLAATMDCCALDMAPAPADLCGDVGGGCCSAGGAQSQAADAHAAHETTPPSDDTKSDSPPCCRACCPTGLVAVMLSAAPVTSERAASAWTAPARRCSDRTLEPAPPPPKTR